MRDYVWAAGTFLGSLPGEVARSLVDRSVRRTFAAGRVLLREGARDSHVFLLLSGFVKVTTAVEGVETLLGIRLPGEVVGEIGALTGEPRNATVSASGPLVAGQLQRGDFEAFLRQRPDASALIAAAVARQLRWANRRRTDFAAYPAHIRLARVLSEMAEVCGRERADGTVELPVPLSQTDLAAMVAIARATVEKALHELRDQGLITTGYRRIVITDPAKLRLTAEP
ncbi:Crp/Fnr family transcriptional regulator [Paractinoplanes lichenicola]|uniref:Crp/Fnr family transcriptional regulator n=1 Tax=Paractinoplanes lichenicola TaxID=2802976 RepID=A0ABS1VY29_9ACTN|nr:Crp/Fnr family transcriptional regulator [Actinoplanes lichenicola]MBL7259400.1 Crp/Fnr family transcriptional regulator [Actinoplanes lichenicola]